MEVPQKIKIGLPMTLPYHSWECKSIYNTEICIVMFIAALFTVAKLWDQPR
jgi:hypothetical protein